MISRQWNTEDQARPDKKAKWILQDVFRCEILYSRRKLSQVHNKSIYPPRIEKKLKDEQRNVEVENASFNPLTFSCTGRDGPMS